jgi:hypothetical protein
MQDGSAWMKADLSCLPEGITFLQEPGIFQGAICEEGRYALLGPTVSIALPIEYFGTSACEPPGCVP